jgi:hypothetical protein
MHERCEIKRADAAIPLTIKLIETSIPPPPITVETDDISPQGLSIIIKIKTKLQNGRLSIQEKGDRSCFFAFPIRTTTNVWRMV